DGFRIRRERHDGQLDVDQRSVFATALRNGTGGASLQAAAAQRGRLRHQRFGNDEDVDWLTDDLRFGVAEQRLERRVHHLHAVVRVDDEDGERIRADESAERGVVFAYRAGERAIGLSAHRTVQEYLKSTAPTATMSKARSPS